MTMRIGVALGLVLSLLATAAYGQDGRRDPTYGATILNSGFTPDPQQYPLSAGGGQSPLNVAELGLVDAVSSEPCTQSFIALPPDFRFHFIEGAGTDFLRFYVIAENGADATLLVHTPDGVWRCNDDSFDSVMPSIDFDDPPIGQYDIWVGTYDASSENPATFFVTQQQSNTPAGDLSETSATSRPNERASGASLSPSGSAGRFAPLSLASGFMPDPMTVAGTSGGGVAVDSAGISASNGGSCAGHVASEPDHIVTLTTAFSYLRIEAIATAGGDTTMIVQDPHGNWWCDDDGAGYPNPRIQGALQAGTYRVWIGSYDAGLSHPYTLSLSEYRP